MKKVFILSKRNIALLGLGTVGKAVYEEINNNVSYVLVKDITKKRNIQLSEKIITNDFQEIIQDKNIDIVIELIGGENPAYNYIKKSIKANKNVITANKEVMGKHGKELLNLAEKNKVLANMKSVQDKLEARIKKLNAKKLDFLILYL